MNKGVVAVGELLRVLHNGIAKVDSIVHPLYSDKESCPSAILGVEANELSGGLSSRCRQVGGPLLALLLSKFNWDNVNCKVFW